FLNLTNGKRANPVNAGTTRSIGFSGDGAQVWIQEPLKGGLPGSTQIWLVPTIGGAPQLLLSKGVEATWAPDGSRLAYFFPPADPIFVADSNGANPKQILTDEKGFH